LEVETQLVSPSPRRQNDSLSRPAVYGAGATVVEVPGSHAIYVSNPKAVADVIEQAASGIK
jgi:hypothetical protein